MSFPCCDLLEKSYLCGINNNHNKTMLFRIEVVICLKSLTFVVSITTISAATNMRIPL